MTTSTTVGRFLEFHGEPSEGQLAYGVAATVKAMTRSDPTLDPSSVQTTPQGHLVPDEYTYLITLNRYTN